MKKMTIALAGVFLLFSACSVFADDSGWYVGLGLGQSKNDSGISALTGTASLDEKDTAFKLFAGYEINKYVAVEAHYLDVGETSLRGNAGDTFSSNGTTYVFVANNVNITAEAISYGLSGVFTYPLHQYFAPFAKLGFQRWEAEMSANSGLGSTSLDDEGTGVVFGAGFRVDLTDNISARAEFERYDMDGDVDILSASLMYRF